MDERVRGFENTEDVGRENETGRGMLNPLLILVFSELDQGLFNVPVIILITFSLWKVFSSFGSHTRSCIHYL